MVGDPTFWSKASAAWHDFLVDVQKANLRLGTTGVWYRGQSKAYAVLPSIFRPNPRFRVDSKLEQLRAQRRGIKDSLVASKHQLDRNDPLRAERIRQLQTQLSGVKSEIGRHKETLWSYDYLLDAEKRAYSDFCATQQDRFSNSWETLVEMRHVGIRTRLLDWTESLAVAVYFALSDWRSAYITWYSSSDDPESILREIKDIDDLSKLFSLPEHAPRIYLLSSLTLARRVTGTSRVLDLYQEQNLDYFQCFVSRPSWNFSLPVPTRAIRTSRRIESQQGVFTVHGTDTRACDATLGTDVFDKVEMSPLCAIYALRLLELLLNMDDFTLMQDKDALGRRINRRHFRC